ncbi:MAG TPA: hypothetical protein VGU22_11560, partial [Methylomirabilota bacterium]|nr:hypothetical protein [Methylomirabilota bacterium]
MSDRAQHRGEVRGLLFQQGADMGTGRGPGTPPGGGKASDFAERQPEAARLPDEGQEAEDIDRIGAVARRGTSSGRENAALLVQPQRLATQPTSRSYLADVQPITCHTPTLNPAPRGKVKEFVVRALSHVPAAGRSAPI